MSDALISSLQAEINRLNEKNASLSKEAKDRRVKGKGLEAELEQLRGQVATLTGERDQLKTKVDAAPSELQATIDQLQGQIRTRDHRDAFAGVKEFEVTGDDGKPQKYTLNDGVKIESVWGMVGYKPEGETPDGKAIAERFGAARKDHPYLFKPVAPETGTNAAGAAQQPFQLGRREAGPGGRTSVSSSTPTPGALAQIDASYGNRPEGRIA